MNRKLIKDLIDAIKAADKRKTSGYDTSAVVRRIEDGTAWVHIPGGVDETPVKLTINASVGDSVQVRVSDGRAFLVGNGSAPPTDDTTAIKATRVAKSAQETAVEAKDEASEAWRYAGTAKDAAESAQESADSAYESAVSANNSANSALTQLSVVEDVAGTLNWIREHGSFVQTTDVTVQENTVYFELINGEYVPIANPDPTKNPTEEGWYVLDVSDSQSEYIMAHLAVTSAGLWVLPFNTFAAHPLVDSAENDLIDSDSNQLVDWSKDPQNADGYKALFASDGMTIYDNTGTSVAHYGTTTTIGAEMGKHVYIDTDSVDIKDGEDTLASFSGNGVALYGQYGKMADFYSYTHYGELELKGAYYQNSFIRMNPIGVTAHYLGTDQTAIADQIANGYNGVYQAEYRYDGIFYNNNGYPVGMQVQMATVDDIASSSWTTVWTDDGENVTLQKGVWLVVFGCAFQTNATGRRQIVLNNSATVSTPTREDIKIPAVSGEQTTINGSRIVNVSNELGEKYYLHLYQNSGQALTCYPFLKAFKLM